MNGAGIDVVDLLTRQHRQVEGQLKALLASEGGPERLERLASAGDELAVHIRAEEAVVYPAVRAARTEDILLESLEEHLSLKRLLADLMAMSPDDGTFEAKCKVLKEQTEHHHKEEEEHLFPKVMSLLDAAARIELGRAVQTCEDELRDRGRPRESLKDQTGSAEPLE